MLKNKFQKISIISVVSLVLLLLTPLSVAKLRSVYLVDFINSTYVSDDGFSNGIVNDVVSYESTNYALDILYYYNVFPQGFSQSELGNNLKSTLESILTDEVVPIYDVYHLLNSIDQLGASLSSSLLLKVEIYLNQTEKSGGGFSPTNGTKAPSLTSTYFALESYDLINANINSTSIHKNWINSCYNAEDGGYGGNSSLSSKLSNTYFATLLIFKLGTLGDFSNSTKTVEYLKSFHNFDGGYVSSSESDVSLISSTFQAIKALTLLNSLEIPNRQKTIEWILDQQTTLDGGFSSSQNLAQKQSSVISSYYAFNTLFELDAISSLNENIGVVEFNWIILLIVLGVIGVVIAFIAYYWQKRRI
ncbi:MAG: hypothetical protein GF317_07450 [Candidatus Lokiarchaeota archaeon]|nr:hypothetical protein [Candidatus Lokiarchaeota archaeon]MBD3199544.1 hypothetical protein [Candidatus Lokiarchaeota archaeon]